MSVLSETLGDPKWESQTSGYRYALIRTRHWVACGPCLNSFSLSLACLDFPYVHPNVPLEASHLGIPAFQSV